MGTNVIISPSRGRLHFDRDVPTARQETAPPVEQPRSSEGPLSGLKRRTSVNSTPRVKVGLKQGELPAAGYLFARALDSRQVDDKNDLSALRLADETVRSSRDLVAEGRSNVASDMVRTRHASTHRKQAVDVLKAHLKRTHGPMTHAQEAGMTSFAQAGTCSDYATLTAALHADKLQPGEMSVYTGSDEPEHAWAEHVRSDDGRTDLVMDPWGTGPAVFREDSVFAQDKSRVETIFGYAATVAGSDREVVEFNRTKRGFSQVTVYPAGTSVREQVDGMANYARAAHGPHFDAHVSQLAAAGSRWGGAVWDATSVLDPDFVDRAEEKLSQMATRAPSRSRLLEEVVGTYVGRSLGQDIKTAAADSSRIVNAGKELLQEASVQAFRQRDCGSDSDSD